MSCNDNQNKIQSGNQEKVKNDTNANNIKMRKILNGDFTFKMIFAPSFQMPFELVIKSQGDEHLLCINSLKWKFLVDKQYIRMKEYLENNYIEFTDGTFYIQESKFIEFLEENRKIDYSKFSNIELVMVDCTTTHGIFYNNKSDSLISYFYCKTNDCDDMNLFNSLFDLIFSTLKTEPYIKLAANVSNYLHCILIKNIFLIKNDPYHIIVLNANGNEPVQELNEIIKKINNEPVILDLSNTHHTDNIFMSNLKNLLLKNIKIYLFLSDKNDMFYKINKKHEISLNNDTLKFFNIDPKIVFDNIDSIYSVIKNDDEVYSIFFPRYEEPVLVPEVQIENNFK
jgi:hypothetical protein